MSHGFTKRGSHTAVYAELLKGKLLWTYLGVHSLQCPLQPSCNCKVWASYKLVWLLIGFSNIFLILPQPFSSNPIHSEMEALELQSSSGPSSEQLDRQPSWGAEPFCWTAFRLEVGWIDGDCSYAFPAFFATCTKYMQVVVTVVPFLKLAIHFGKRFVFQNVSACVFIVTV